MVRNFFVVGLYSFTTISEQKKRIQEMLEVSSGLYVESLYLQKSMSHIEKITAASHDLYRKLKKEGRHQLGVQALQIAQEIHEVKKDSQRILAGLTKLTVRNRNTSFFLSDLLNLVVNANEKYSELLQKEIDFKLQTSINFETDQHIPLLALFNNLTANAVEAITDKGVIQIEAFEESGYTCFIIQDSGKGIPSEDLSIIFEPGYTTKYNHQGVAATGIGLSHVQDIVGSFGGKINIHSSGKGTIFTIRIPTNHIRKRDD
jgi:two-component system sensor histidine kinase YcbA